MTTPSALRVCELTPPGAGGVSVLRLEGPGALTRVRSLARSLGPGPGPSLVRLAFEGEDLDEALCVVLGEHCVELHLHGSPPLVQRVRGLLVPDQAAACAPASLEARAEQLLASAPSEAGARILLDQLQGALRRDLEALRAVAGEGAFAPALEALLERGRVAGPALVPARVVLAGPANAGKSTLFNALFGRLRVVVSTQAGTTRDAVCERIALGAYVVDLYDTAGERAVPGAAGAAEIEREGQAIGRSVRGVADLVLWLCPADGSAGEPPPGAVCLTSRSDLDPLSPVSERPGFSALADPEAAARLCEAEFRAHLRLPADPWEPGAGVPFEGQLLDELATLGDGADADETRLVIDALLQR